jgi:hypothetical protein
MRWGCELGCGAELIFIKLNNTPFSKVWDEDMVVIFTDGGSNILHYPQPSKKD